MLTHPTLDQLHALGLHGMAKGFKELNDNPEARALEHPEWLTLLLEHETTLRRQKRFEARARAARLRQSASIEDVDYRAARGLDRALFRKLATCEWIRMRRNLIITGPCGVGKSWLACALGNTACKEDFSVLYHRIPRLFAALGLAAVTAATPNCCAASAGSNSSSSMTGDRKRSRPSRRATCSKSSRIVTMRARLFSPARRRSI